MNRDKIFAVATGDIVDSSRLAEEARAKLPQVLREAVRDIGQHWSDAVMPDIDIFRGDEWQMLVTDPVLSLRLAFFMRVYLRSRFRVSKVDSRVAVGIGTINLFPSGRISEGDGEAYQLSGKAMQQMAANRRLMVLSSIGVDTASASLVDALVHMADELVTRWTANQCEAILGAMKGWTQKDIGQKWSDGGISQQAVAQHLDSAGWDSVKAALAGMEDWLKCALKIRVPE